MQILISPPHFGFAFHEEVYNKKETKQLQELQSYI